MRFQIVAVIPLLAACSSLTARVQGRVVDDRNQPVPGARVELGMYPSDTDPAPEWSLQSNESGDFDGLITFRWRGGSPIRAVDPEGKRGGIAHINRHRDPVTIVVHPLMRVTGRVSFEKLPKPLREWNEGEGINRRGASVNVVRKLQPVDGKTPPPEYVVSTLLKGGRFEFMLPAGDYEIRSMSWHEPLTREFTVRPGAETDLGVLEAIPTREQALYDAPAPELKLADARGIPRDFQWSSVRGKWVLLFFWDYRNKANNWLSGLIRRWNEWEEHRDRFEIIAVHNCDAVLTVNDLERYLQWETDERDLKIPFPVAIDDDEKSFDAYALAEGPGRRGSRVIVINPDGTVEFVRGPETEYVRRKLEAEK